MLRMLAAIVVALGFVASASAFPAPPKDIDFKVYRDGDEIGHHRVRFTQDGARTIADVDIELAVRFAGIRVFYYKHTSREIWQDGKLVAIDSQTYDDGDRHQLSLRRDSDLLKIAGSKFQGEAPGTLVPTSYWFADTLKQQQIIDTQNGRVFPVAIAAQGRETIEAAGRQIEANRYTLSEQIVMNLWYDDAGNWVKTSFDARGSTIDYVLQPSHSASARNEGAGSGG